MTRRRTRFSRSFVRRLLLGVDSLVIHLCISPSSLSLLIYSCSIIFIFDPCFLYYLLFSHLFSRVRIRARSEPVLNSFDVFHPLHSPAVTTCVEDVVRLDRNKKARARYASLSLEKKNALSNKRRVQRDARRYQDQSSNWSEVNSASIVSRDSSSFLSSPVSVEPGLSRRLSDPLNRMPVGRFDRLRDVPLVSWTLPALESCSFCGAYRFYREVPGFCCGSGQIVLAPVVLCPILMFLFTDPDSEIAKEFRRKGRSYNHGFAFTSIGIKVVADSWWAKHGVYSLKVHGKVSHFMNPIDGSANTTDLLQLFFLDTAEALDDAVLGGKDLRRDVIDLLVQALAGNPYSKFFKRLSSWDDLRDARIVIRTSSDLDQRNRNIPTVDEVAGVWKDGDESTAGSERDIRVYTEAGRSHKVNYYYSCYNPLQYPLLFPYGEPGWHPGIPKNTDMRAVSLGKGKAPTSSSLPFNAAIVASAEEMLAAEEEGLQRNKRNRGNVSCREYSCYQAQIRDGDNSYLLHAGRLGQEFIIDMYIKLETSRLDYYRSEQLQTEIRTESFQGIVDSLLIDDQVSPNNVGQRIVLPSSFIGGPRDMRKRYVNAMALVQRYGKPDVFLTMTCNPGWKEIIEHLLPCQKADDRPDLIARVFKAKLEELKNEIVKKKLFGEVAAYVYTVEYQKRGLPHAHWVIILTARHKIVAPAVYDEIICAELPDGSHPLLRSFVVKHMMHGPCGDSNKKNVCMREGKCKNYYPKEFADSTTNGQNSYPNYRRRNDGRSVVYRNVRLDNRSVVPYCPYLLIKLDCHINVEICADVKLVKYLYKYIYKGHDKLAYHVVSDVPVGQRDEIQEYQDGRYICAPEAFWRVFGFPMSEMYPPVIVLPVHLPNHQPLRFGMQRSLQQSVDNPLSSQTMLTEFFVMNSSNSEAKNFNLLYKNFPEYFVWESVKHKWKVRQKKTVVGRLCTVSPVEGERYFERLLLNNVRCPTSFDDLLTVCGIKYDTFREAAVRRGLLQSDDYVDSCLAEAVVYQMPYSFRVLFAMLLVHGIIGNPQSLWDKYYESLSEDFARNSSVTEIQVLRLTIAAIDTVLTSMEKCITDFPIKFPIEHSTHKDRYSKDYENELSMKVSTVDMLLVDKLNVGQRAIYDMVVSKIDANESGVFFLDGPGGTGKTFLYRALLAYVRSNGLIALPVASSGVAASLLPCGRTAHSRFKLPFDPEDKSIGKISKQSSLAKMIIEAKLIIWDEASMANRFSIESLDKLLIDFCDPKKDFGGKIVLFGGDFRQTLPIVVHGSRDAMIGASFVSSSLWRKVIKVKLHENMRAKEDPAFTSFILRVGNGEVPYLFNENIRIPSHMLIPFTDINSSLDRLIQSVYPSFDAFVTNPLSFVDRAILTPKNDCVAELNDLLIDRFPGELKEYLSFNRATDCSQQAEYEDFLNCVSASGLPPHLLKLKKNCPIMLLRNLNPIQGLCNGTRLICKELGDNFIGAEIASGDFKGIYVFIPRIPIESSDKLKCPIPFKRMQFPVRPCFAMTINKAQGQTLDFVGIYLKEPVFAHGQLYVALSRAKSGASVKLLIHPDSKIEGYIDYTKNMVYGEVFLLAKGVLLINIIL
ncbi:hypothetical protein ACJIZ3_008828 [Penstemon smallii]|uniref:ATP-dependent DNA helicase n=1 Tax=Penstemon smallii TaxID=265156 RepID=A0ABD3TAV6_9LAMI